MASLIYTFSSDAVPATAHVAAFKGHEAISEPYRVDVALILKNDEEIDTTKAVGTRASLHIATAGGQPFSIHGYMVRIELLHAWSEQTLYRVTLAPEWWNRSLGRHSNVFVDKTPPELIEFVLKTICEWTDEDVELRLTRDYPKYAHICQYRESDYQFLSRWMEREGMYYYFDHSAEAAEKLIITDDKAHHEPSRASAARYVPGSAGDHMALEAFDTLRRIHAQAARWVSLQDYDDLNPALDVYGADKVVAGGKGDQWDYGPNVLTPDAAVRLAKVGAEANRAHEVSFQATGRVFELRAGYTFDVEGHPRADMNGKYLVTRLEYQGNQSAALPEVKRLLDLEGDEEYRVSVCAIRADVQFRAEFKTPRPRVHGVERGFVDGPAESEYAQIDEHGRYKVKIHLDEMQWVDSPAPDGSYSTWLRMLQPYGGTPEGFHFPLHKGTQVAIIFLGGDPDRPVIAGVAPNAATPSPVTSANKSLNVIQTHIGNRIELDDNVDKPCIRIICPNPTTIETGSWGPTARDRGVHIVADTKPGPNNEPGGGHLVMNIAETSTIAVGGRQDEQIDGDVHEAYGADQLTAVTGLHKLTAKSQLFDIGGGGRGDHVSGPVTEDYDSDQSTTIGGARKLTVGGAVTQSFGGSLTQNVTGSVTQHYCAAHVLTTDGSSVWSIGGPQFWTLSAAATHTYGASLTEMIAGPRTCIAGGPIVNVAPSIQNIQPSHESAWGFSDTTFGAKNATGGFSAETVGMKISQAGMSGSDSGIKFEAYGCSMVIGGQVSSQIGSKLECIGQTIKTTALFAVI